MATDYSWRRALKDPLFWRLIRTHRTTTTPGSLAYLFCGFMAGLVAADLFSWSWGAGLVSAALFLACIFWDKDKIGD